MDELEYKPDIEELKRHFDLTADYLCVKFLLLNSRDKNDVFDFDLFTNVREFCKEWSVDESHTSNLYYIVSKTQTTQNLNGLKEWVEPEQTGYNFRSEAYIGLAIGYESYFKGHGIAQTNNMRKYEIIGRLIMMKIAFRRNRKLPTEENKSRIDVDPSDPNITGKQIAEMVRNWVKRQNPGTP